MGSTAWVLTDFDVILFVLIVALVALVAVLARFWGGG